MGDGIGAGEHTPTRTPITATSAWRWRSPRPLRRTRSLAGGHPATGCELPQSEM